jgi:thiamine pyrophosphate-dependent acetolactate synthase large subunit-like protein
VFTTAGPGLTNAVTGMLAARWDGAHVIFVSAATSAANRGRVATQETIARSTAPLACAGWRVTTRSRSSTRRQLAPVIASSPAAWPGPAASSPT